MYCCDLVDGRLYWGSVDHAQHVFYAAKDQYCCICICPLIRSLHSSPSSLSQPNSGILVSEKDELVFTGCCRNNIFQIIVELVMTSTGLVIVSTFVLMMVTCLLQDKGSVSFIRRSLMPFGRPENCRGLF